MNTQASMNTETIEIPWSNKPADKDGWYLYVRFNTTQWRAVLVNQGFILNNQDPDQFYAFGVPVMEFEPGFWCGPFVNPHTLPISQTLTWEPQRENNLREYERLVAPVRRQATKNGAKL